MPLCRDAKESLCVTTWCLLTNVRLSHREMEGTHYEVEEEKSGESDVFIVKKLHVSNFGKTADTLALYYILGGDIFQAPDLFTLLSSRLVRLRACVCVCVCVRVCVCVCVNMNPIPILPSPLSLVSHVLLPG